MCDYFFYILFSSKRLLELESRRFCLSLSGNQPRTHDRMEKKFAPKEETLEMRKEFLKH